ncbi:hypothetical protein [Argonema galeatum]|uniref:hypothetical protein n=1 Tax=Argonema galeatum TaxID=2942762 RepID=UPI002011F833|nr:hypothetical protein [Argonema galeatum]MCL1466384.1 hypothetical protein [Argonema galeatum A003/A1]
MKDKLLNWLNVALMWDFFLVLSGFLWFAIALLGKAAGVPLGFDLWHRLWEPLFTPAIGILMAGAILSGVTSWISKRLNSGAGG